MSRHWHLFLVVVVLTAPAIVERTAHADPTTAGCLAASESSIALRKGHKLREASAHLLTCSAASCPADVREECIRHIAEVNAAIPTVVFEATRATGTRCWPGWSSTSRS